MMKKKKKEAGRARAPTSLLRACLERTAPRPPDHNSLDAAHVKRHAADISTSIVQQRMSSRLRYQKKYVRFFAVTMRSDIGMASSLAAMMKSFSVSPASAAVQSSTVTLLSAAV